MKTLATLIDKYQNTKFGNLFIICIHCKDENESSRFLEQAEREGFAFEDGSLPTGNPISKYYDVKMNNTIALPTLPIELIGKIAGRVQNMVIVEYSDLIQNY